MPTVKSRVKSEQELSEHIKKAVSTTETAPKQKHVRACIVYTWDFQTSVPFWSLLRMQPVLTDQVVCYKSLITIHKVLVGGPHVVLSEALAQQSFFESCVRQHGAVTLGFGYGPLIQAYCEFIMTKLEFHRTNPEFTGNFDYEEYISLKGVSNLDEGYQTIEKLMDLQERVDRFQKTVFINVRPMAQNECRIASLVPLVEESYGIYKFITSMISAMHLCVESPDPLVPLVERYNVQFYALKKFYAECETLRYLVSLVEIPKLPDTPPSFIDGPVGGSNHRVERVKSPPKPQPIEEPAIREPIVKNSEDAEDLLGTFGESLSIDDGRAGKSRSGSGLEQLISHTVTTVPVVDDQMMQALRQAQMQVASLSQQLQEALFRHQQDQALVQQYNEQLMAVKGQLESYSMTSQSNQGYDIQIFKLTEQVQEWKEKYEAMSREAAKWKSKYEGMAALYQQLRVEHLEVLSKLRDLQNEQETSKQAETEMAGTLGDRLAQELLKVSQAIDAAAQRLENMKSDPSLAKLSSLNAAVHSTIVDGASTITSAIGNLIKYAIQAQSEIVAAGKGSGTPDAFYKKHSQWTNGLISAAQAVAAATMTLVETADGVIKGTHQLQHLVAASNSVAAATMQLVTASRVKAANNSIAQPLLETAAKAVTNANRRLVDSATGAIEPSKDLANSMAKLPSDPFTMKVEELERQAKVLELEKELSFARNDLASLRKAAYSNAPNVAVTKPVELPALKSPTSSLEGLSSPTLSLDKSETVLSTSQDDRFGQVDQEDQVEQMDSSDKKSPLLESDLTL